jgi:glycosyltransferase involved in cell wall biosynthesis
MKHFEAIVVDNGSLSSDVNKLIEYTKPNLEYVFNTENLMVAAGRNVGAKKATGEFILFLDNDMVVPERWLPKMLANIDQFSCVATSPQVVDLKNGQEFVRFVATVVKNGAIHEIKEEGVYECDFLPGGSLFVNRLVFNEYPFDEKFIFGVEDYDWCMKLKADGYKFINTPDVVFIHAKNTVERTVTPYDDAERKRKGSSFIEDSIRLFLYRYQKQLPNQWKQPGWLQWAVGRNNEPNVASLQELMLLIDSEVAELYPDEVVSERTGFNEDIGVELGRCG